MYSSSTLAVSAMLAAPLPSWIEPERPLAVFVKEPIPCDEDDTTTWAVMREAEGTVRGVKETATRIERRTSFLDGRTWESTKSIQTIIALYSNSIWAVPSYLLPQSIHSKF
jgi:hypothetical protein